MIVIQRKVSIPIFYTILKDHFSGKFKINHFNDFHISEYSLYFIAIFTIRSFVFTYATFLQENGKIFPRLSVYPSINISFSWTILKKRAFLPFIAPNLYERANSFKLFLLLSPFSIAAFQL